MFDKVYAEPAFWGEFYCSVYAGRDYYLISLIYDDCGTYGMTALCDVAPRYRAGVFFCDVVLIQCGLCGI